MDPPEILVHTSAPSTKKNDDIYHAIAEEYSRFEPYQVHGKETASSLVYPSLVQSHAPDHVTEGPVTPTNANKGIPSKIISPDTSKDLYGSFPSQFYTEKRVVESSVHHGTWQSTQEDPTPSSSRLGALEALQTKWKEQQRTESDLGSSLYMSTIKTASSWNDAMIDDTQLALQMMESQVRDDFSTISEDTEEDELVPETEFVRETELVPETQFVTTQLPTGTLRVQRAQSQSDQVQDSHTNHTSSSSLDTPSPIASAHLQTRRPLSSQISMGESFASSFSMDSGLYEDFQGLPFEILPPLPKITTDCPHTLPSQITRFFTAIKKQNPERFKPLYTSRGLEHDERGHWRVDCRNWPLHIQLELWRSFGNYVRRGQMGWGVAMYRDEHSLHSLDLIRVYCWGEVVEHVWIALWLCSKGKMAGSGSRWLDGNDDVIVDME